MSRTILGSKLLGETIITTFDFTSRLALGETISTAVVSAATYSGTDGAPSALISGSTTISGAKVTQKITGGVLGTIYDLVCTVTTSLGQTLLLAGFMTISQDFL